ncbi:hypothetical protein PM3016_6638 [Paenibacillus mucilaginosus 3016]|uniref:Chemotaxis protein n=1 Tax=Paenibacillus mucilaginosus 3016 TaxID=1116391 RepID=H6NM91_9BACL|nr:hypothetical protein PM3016_6638 [Paenibacillus mucilaginosus 3016]
MSQSLAVLIVHGMGQQKEEYADELKEQLADAYRLRSEDPEASTHLCMEAVQWSHVFESGEQELFERLVRRHDLRYQGLRRFIIHYLADAIAYQPVETAEHNYDAVHHTISGALRRLSERCGPAAPLCVIAHSLGAVIASNYFYDLQYEVRQPAAECEHPVGMRGYAGPVLFHGYDAAAVEPEVPEFQPPHCGPVAWTAQPLSRRGRRMGQLLRQGRYSRLPAAKHRPSLRRSCAGGLRGADQRLAPGVEPAVPQRVPEKPRGDRPHGGRARADLARGARWASVVPVCRGRVRRQQRARRPARAR